MVTILNENTDHRARKYLDDLESAMMAYTIAQGSDLPKERQKALYSLWAYGSFNAAANGHWAPSKPGLMTWQHDGDDNHLVYHAPNGTICHLAKIYEQADGTWAALVNAGVGEDRYEAMAKAEWAISRLTAEDALPVVRRAA